MSSSLPAGNLADTHVIYLLAAAAITGGAGQADAVAEAWSCFIRHQYEEPTIDSAVRMVAEMKQWAEGR